MNVFHGPGPRVSTWFCTDSNGEGSKAYHWPEVRKKLIKMGAMAVNIADYQEKKAANES
jgi:hypothetical protein